MLNCLVVLLPETVARTRLSARREWRDIRAVAMVFYHWASGGRTGRITAVSRLDHHQHQHNHIMRSVRQSELCCQAIIFPLISNILC